MPLPIHPKRGIYMNEVEIQSKIKQNAKNVGIVLTIGKILVVFVIVLLFLTAALTACIYTVGGPAEFSHWIVSEDVLSSFGVGTSVPAGMDPTTAFIQASAIFLVSATVYLLTFAGMIWAAARIFAEIRESGVPFTQANARSLKHVAICMALLCVVPVITDSIGWYITGISVTLGYLSIEGLIVAAVLYCLAHIFEYGTLLQKQADETL